MTNKRREGWYDKAVFGISVFLMIIGVCCIALGAVSLYYALSTTCYHVKYHEDYNRHYNGNGWNNGGRYGQTTTTTVPTTTEVQYEVTDCRYDGSLFASGIWVGIMLMATGIIGMVASRTKTTCMILSSVILSVPCFFFAVAGIGFSIYSQMDGRYDLTNKRPFPMYVCNGALTFMSFAAMVLDILLFSFACRAICCCKKFNTVHYTEITGPPDAVVDETNVSSSNAHPASDPNAVPNTQQQFTSWPGFTPMQLPPQMQMSSGVQNAPQMFMLVPNGQGGFVPQPFQLANFDQINAQPAQNNQPVEEVNDDSKPAPHLQVV